MVVAIRVQLARTKDESGGPGPKLHQTRSGLRGLLLRPSQRAAAQLFGKSSGLYADCDLAQVDQTQSAWPLPASTLWARAPRGSLVEPSETRVTLVLLRVLYSSTPSIGRVLPMNPAPAGATRVVEALMKLGPDEGGI